MVLWPFFTRRATTQMNSPADDLRRSLRRARERIYEEIKVLQQERFMRDLTDEAYQAQLQALRLRAAELMREQESVQDTISAIDAETDQALREATHDDEADEGPDAAEHGQDSDRS